MESKRILLVEDNPMHRRFIGDVLRSEGYALVEAENMTQARELFRTATNLDLIILDQMLPEGTGADLLVDIQQNSNLAKLPVLFITAYPEDKDMVRLGKTKKIAVLAKPIRNYNDILKEVKTLLDKKLKKRGQ